MHKFPGLKLFIMAGIAGVLAVASGYYYLDLRERQLLRQYAPQTSETAALVVPVASLEKGSILKQEDIAIKQVPVDFIPSNAVLAENWKQAVGRTLLAPLQRGRPITWSAIAGNAVDRFSENVEIGKRAKTIKISKVNSIDGLLRPGDRIDIYGLFSSGDIGQPAVENFSDQVLLLLIERAEVLAAGREDASGRKYENFIDNNSADGFNMSFSTVTLHVNEYQAAKIEIAQEAGELMAVLRNPEDTSKNNVPQLRVSDLLKPDPAEAVELVLGENGEVLGRIIGNKVVDENGRVIGEVVNGEVVSLAGEPLGRIVSGRIDGSGKLLSDVTEEVVRDADGNIIGRVVNGQVLDESGKVIGVVKDGVAMSLDGETLGEIGAIKQSASNRFIGFIAGGKGKDGVNPVQRLLVE
jgi:Flp pilus assembly protein CpaB